MFIGYVRFYCIFVQFMQFPVLGFDAMISIERLYDLTLEIHIQLGKQMPCKGFAQIVTDNC